MNFQIVQAQPADLDQILLVLTTAVTDNFRTEGVLESKADDLREEIEAQIETVKLSYVDPDEYFLVARHENKVIGTAAFGCVNSVIKTNLDLDYSNIPEIKSVYILPEFQKQGIGKLFFKHLITELNRRRITSFVLDCGYQHSLSYWRKLLGEPELTLKDHYGDMIHHLIWYQPVNKYLTSEM